MFIDELHHAGIWVDAGEENGGLEPKDIAAYLRDGPCPRRVSKEDSSRDS